MQRNKLTISNEQLAIPALLHSPPDNIRGLEGRTSAPPLSKRDRTSALRTLHSALSTLHSALSTLHSTLFTHHSALRTPHSALFTAFLLLPGLLLPHISAASSPYPVTIVSATTELLSGGSNILHISADIDDGFSSHSEDWSISAGGNEYHPVNTSDTELSGSVKLDFILSAEDYSAPVSLTCSACSDTACLLPRTFPISATSVPAPAESKTIKAKYQYSSADGYMNSPDFAAFLKGKTTTGAVSSQNGKNGIILFLTFLLAGIALNLTPCVLPLIPVQLAILGIGANRTTKANGFKRGLTYGLGMAIAYGALGLFIVLTGGFFGTIQSSPWFNLSIAVIFTLLALSLFDIFSIDFSHYRRSSGSLASTAAVFLLGAVTALLAGTCVAPAVIAALLLSGTMYAAGSVFALALPLALGIGMGLPWPFIGAGLASLPRPGKWMKWVKIIMAAAVLLVAGVYFHKAYQSFTKTSVQADSIDAADGIESVSTRIDTTLSSGKPVLLDFKASWCGSCTAMEQDVFTDAAVSSLLGEFSVLKIQAEDPADPAVKSVLSEFNVHGLPAFRIIRKSEDQL